MTFTLNIIQSPFKPGKKYFIKFKLILIHDGHFDIIFHRYTITVTVSEKQPYQVREYVWCLSVPPRCSKYTIKYKIVNKAQTLFKSRPVEQCCDGYAKIDEDRCIPVCREECLHGTCIAPDVCQCTEGFGGPRCHISKFLSEILKL